MVSRLVKHCNRTCTDVDIDLGEAANTISLGKSVQGFVRLRTEVIGHQRRF